MNISIHDYQRIARIPVPNIFDLLSGKTESREKVKKRSEICRPKERNNSEKCSDLRLFELFT